MGRRTLLVGLAAGLFFATSVAWLAGSAYAAPKVEIKISAEEERPLFKQGVQPPPADEHKWPVQLKIEVACPLVGGPGCVGTVAKPVGTLECEYMPRPIGPGPVRHGITRVVVVGATLQFESGGPIPTDPAAVYVVEAQWEFGVAKPGEPKGQSLKAIVAGPPNTACKDAGVPASFSFRGTDTIKSEITNKP